MPALRYRAVVRSRWSTLVVLLSLACPAADDAARGQPEPLAPGSASNDPASSEPASSGPAKPELDEPAPLLIVRDPTTLIELERELGLVAVVGEAPLDAIRASLSARLARDRREDPSHTGVGLRHVHRQFDLRWLSATDTRFELIGVVNRLDRHAFGPGLGETRLIYRLAYTRTHERMRVDSRLPMTINVVFSQRPAAGMPEGAHADRLAALRELAERWQVEPGLEGAALAARLREPGRPLAPEQLDPALLESVEIDVQTERWPSTIRPDLAGHAEYLLQVFRHVDARWQASPLENTPDVARLAGDRQAKAELLAWLADPAQREALVAGTLVVPDRFLADAATSVTPRGLARLANRPWSQLFTVDELAPLAESDARLGGALTLRRRLDALSCQGCHQSRSIAGFHLLGDERDPSQTVDALQLGSSPHLEVELERRASWFAALHSEAALDHPPSELRESAEFAPGGAWGTRCGLPGTRDFATWTCAAGLVCTPLDDPELGTCLEPEPGGVGGVCEVGRIKASADHHRDRIVDVEPRACAEGGVCNDDRVGFPQGMCTFACEAGRPEGECGVIPNLRSFNDCLARDEPFRACIVATSSPAALRACDRDNPCRDDYICARSGSERGVCLPPYFLFQLRVDGHPSG